MVNIITLNVPFVTQIKHILIMSTSSIRHPKFFSKVMSCVWGFLLAICLSYSSSKVVYNNILAMFTGASGDVLVDN